MKAARFLSTRIQMRLLKPQHFKRAGRVVRRMQDVGWTHGDFSKKDINDVVMALCARDEKEMQPSFDLFSLGGDCINAEDFREVVPLLGETLTEEEITALFSKADKDRSGNIDFTEYCGMLDAMQMKADDSKRMEVVARERATSYQSPRLIRHPDLGKDLGPAIRTMINGGHIDPATVYHLIKKLFDDADLDESGALDKQELGELMKAYYRLEGIARNINVAQREVDAAMDKYDTDRSGAMELLEFVRMFCDTSPDAAFRTQIPVDVLQKVHKVAEKSHGNASPITSPKSPNRR